MSESLEASESWGRWVGGITWSKNLDVDDAEGPYPMEDAAEGVGDRLRWSGGPADSEKDRDINEDAPDGWFKLAGMGVDTPRALASFARRWGGKGAFGCFHVGDCTVGGELESRDERGVSLG